MHHPCAETFLARLSRHWIDLREQRRRKIEGELSARLECLLQPLAKRLRTVKTGDLIFILIGHQFEQIGGHRARKLLFRPDLFLLCVPYHIDKCPISVGIGAVLIFCQKLRSPIDQLVKR